MGPVIIIFGLGLMQIDPLLTNICAKNDWIITVSFPVTLTFRTQICFPSYSCPALCFHWIRCFNTFPISRKSYTQDGRTDRQTHGRTGSWCNA